VGELTDRDIVLYALYILGGWQKRVHTEDVALRCFELAPSKFSWTKYPQYPDITPARFTLETAKKTDSGELVKGQSERKKSGTGIGGWVLTQAGITWIKGNLSRIEKSLDREGVVGDRLIADRKIYELIRSVAFKKFKAKGRNADISTAEMAESLLCTVNAKPEVIRDRLDQLFTIAEVLKRAVIKDYVLFCKEKMGEHTAGGEEK
jgi:hypothetical protein